MTTPRSFLVLTFLALAGCPETRLDLVGADADADGFHSGVDCDDDDGDVNPGATEVPYNGLDDDCDEATPDDDLDGDGVPSADDCADDDARRHPTAVEVCNGVDDDCDGDADEGLGTTWYADTDGDGFGDPTAPTTRCDGGNGAFVVNDLDCDDDLASVNPSAAEECNDRDDDCDGAVDTDTVSLPTWYRDADGDLFGDASDAVVGCDAPPGHVPNPDDCDDTAGAGASKHPGAAETCNGQDDDCDVLIDEGAVGATTFFLDHDGDTFGSPDSTVVACANPDPLRWVTNDDDCYDLSSTARPGGTEVCNGIDDDCDGTPDDAATDRLTWRRDLDGDGFGDAATTELRCDSGGGAWVVNALDCDDTLATGATSYPGAAEICDGRDNDCNTIADDDPDGPLWYEDFDGDGFGDPGVVQIACSDPSTVGEEWVTNADDCDDLDATIKPGATETCDGEDDDCDGLVDDGATPLLTWYLDGDGDGQGRAAGSIQGCSPPGDAYVDNDDDCDDLDDAIYDGAPRACDGVDHDCDGLVDHDHDSDGFLDDDACPGGLDCNDTQGAGASVYPGAGCSYGRSCLEAMTVDPGLLGEDAVLMLDPDENGSLTAYYCDFTDDDAYGPGWTLLYYSPFQVAGDNAGWEFWNAQTNAADNGKAVVTTCGQSSILGGYNQTARGWLHRVIDSGLVPHEEIVVDFRFFQLDTWNSENAFLRLERDSAASPGASPADGAFLWYQSIARGTSSLCGQANTIDGSFQITRHIWDSDDVFRLEVGTTLDQTADDESFGIDDVSVWIR